jgi:hypothetical protein
MMGFPNRRAPVTLVAHIFYWIIKRFLNPSQRFKLGKRIFKCSKKIQCFQLLTHMAGSSVNNFGEVYIIKILRSLQEKSSA